jgi:hypothetical protein
MKIRKELIKLQRRNVITTKRLNEHRCTTLECIIMSNCYTTRGTWERDKCYCGLHLSPVIDTRSRTASCFLIWFNARNGFATIRSIMVDNFSLCYVLSETGISNTYGSAVMVINCGQLNYRKPHNSNLEAQIPIFNETWGSVYLKF